MNSASELVLRNTTAIASGSVLLFNPPQDSLSAELSRLIPTAEASATESIETAETTAGSESPVDNPSQVTVFTQIFGDHEWFVASGISSAFGLLPEKRPLAETIVLFLPREKDRLEFLLHFLAENMSSQSSLLLVGEIKAGIKSAVSRLEKRFQKVKKLDSARHCVLYSAKEPISAEPFRQENYLQEYTIPTERGDLQIKSLPGAFAHGRLDKGTKFLLNFLQSEQGLKLGIKGKVMDFGCGAGVIGLFLKQQNPEIDLELLDVSAPALESARKSLAANHLQATVTASNGLANVSGRSNWIISNPPFHTGIATELEISRQMFAMAPAKLGLRGRMLLVCNRHLPYESALSESFGKLEQVAGNGQFKVLLAQIPARQTQRRR